MLKRKIEVFLENWYKNKDHSPLIVYGARQIGKSTSIPIEVKTGIGRSKSLNKMLDTGMFKYGIKLANQNIGFANGKFTFPYFLAFKLKQFLSDKIEWK